MLPGLAPAVVSGGQEPTIVSTFHGRTPHNSSGSTQTFAGEPIGTASSDRIVVVGISWAIAGSANINSVTIGGASGTVVGESDGTNSGVAIAFALVPSGTTATVAVNFSASVARCCLATWSIKNYLNATPYDSAFPVGGGAASRTATLDLSAAGVAFAIAFNGSDGDGAFTNASEDFDDTGADRTFGARAIGSGAAQVGLGIQHSNCRVICAVSWGGG